VTLHWNPNRISTRARVLKAVRDYFRECGMSPSFSQIGLRAGIPKQRVGRYLDELQRDEYLSYVKGEACSIVLVDPGANLSDADLRAACIGRGLPDPFLLMRHWPAIMAAIPEAFPVDPIIPDDIADLLKKL
jgi:hypothetical protein